MYFQQFSRENQSVPLPVYWASV